MTKVFSYLGKSTGKGGLGIWTHNLKTIDFLNYTSDDYIGPAIKMGAGVQAFEAYAAAYEHGLRVVGGECPTVGLAGGYTQGGGHSMLSSAYGLGADQPLEWEIVTSNGTLLIASPTKNQDIYWALSGGGGGTYGVVLSLTAKAHPEGIIGGGDITALSDGIDPDIWWNVLNVWHTYYTKISERGGAAVYIMGSESFKLIALTIPEYTTEQVIELLDPFTTYLDRINSTYTINITSLPTYYEHYEKYLGPLPYGQFAAADILGGRLLPRTIAESKTEAVTAAWRNISEAGEFSITGVLVNVSHSHASNEPSSNAVLPAWRTTSSFVVFNHFLAGNETVADLNGVSERLTYVYLPQIEKLMPGSGAYLNEANFRQPDWKEDFYGANYDKLKAIKKEYDPQDLFYATTAVGSDAWTVASDGRLCRA
jgi:FAD/FMN-containing dehydrogenase